MLAYSMVKCVIGKESIRILRIVGTRYTYICRRCLTHKELDIIDEGGTLHGAC